MLINKLYTDSENRMILPIYQAHSDDSVLCFVSSVYDNHQFIIKRYKIEEIEVRQINPTESLYKKYYKLALQCLAVYLVRDIKYLVLQQTINIDKELELIKKEYFNEKTTNI